MSEKIIIGKHEFEGVKISTAKSNILIIHCDRGFLGCGYFDMSVAERLGDCAAVVTGVKSFEDMLATAVVRLSPAAAARGIKIGMAGRDALEAMVR